MERSATDWQHLVVMATLGWAVAYLVHRVLRTLRAPDRAGCGSCGNARGCATGNAKPFVSIDSLKTPANADEERRGSR